MILGLSETHWNKNGEFILRKGNFVFSSGTGVHTDVAVAVDGRYKNILTDARAMTNRQTVFRMEAAPYNLSTIQAYAQTSAAPDAEIDEFLSVLEVIEQRRQATCQDNNEQYKLLNK